MLFSGCCIFEKKRLPTDESSDDDSDQDECDHCHGHVEQRAMGKQTIVENADEKFHAEEPDVVGSNGDIIIGQ